MSGISFPNGAQAATSRAPLCLWIPNGLPNGVTAPQNIVTGGSLNPFAAALSAAGGGTARNYADLVDGSVCWRLLASAAGGSSVATWAMTTANRVPPIPAWITAMMAGAGANPNARDMTQSFEGSIRIVETVAAAVNRRVSFGWQNTTNDLVGILYHPELYGPNWQLIATIDLDFTFLVPPMWIVDTGIPAADGLPHVLRLEVSIATNTPAMTAYIDGTRVAQYATPYGPMTLPEATIFLNGLFQVVSQKSGANANVMDAYVGATGILYDVQM